MNRKLITIVLCLALLMIVSIAEASPILYNGHYYDGILYTGTWDQANADALTKTYSGQPGHLVTITTEAEYNTVKSVFSGLGWSWGIAWIGATQAGDNSVSWINGEGTVDVTGWSPSPWGSGQPGTGKYGVDMKGPGYGNIWETNIASYNGYGAYIIEYEAAPAAPSAVGYNPAWLLITFVSLIFAGGYLLRRRAA